MQTGVAYLGRGFAFLRERPRLFVLGMIPALLVFLVLAAAYVGLVLNAGGLVSWATPFADDWHPTLRGLTRVLLVLLVLVGALVLASSVFVGVTLAVGDPFYERIWRETETALGGPVPVQGVGLLRSARDGAELMGLGLVSSLLVLSSGVLPVVGPVLGAVVGVLLSGRLLARELVARPLEARGLDRAAQHRVMHPQRRPMLEFGIATQLWFLVPFGGVLVMPAAVVGATMLAREALERTNPGVTPPADVR